MADLLHDLLPAAAARAADKVAVIDREQSVSYAQLNQLVDRAAAGLTALGILRGDRVAVLMPKRIEKVAALLAVLKAGAIAVPVNALLKAPQVGHILRDSGATALITNSARLPDLLAELGVLSGLRAIVAVEDPGSEPVGGLAVMPWPELVANQGPIAGRPAPNDAAMIFYTSGSTGKPKGVVVSHRNLVVGARSVAEYLQCRADDRVLAVLSFSFDYGFNQVATTLLVGRDTRAARLPPAAGSAADDRAREDYGARRRAADLDPARRARLAGRRGAFAALHHEFRRRYAAGDDQTTSGDVAGHADLPDVRPDRGVSFDLPAAGAGCAAPGFDRPRDSECRGARAAARWPALRGQ